MCAPCEVSFAANAPSSDLGQRILNTRGSSGTCRFWITRIARPFRIRRVPRPLAGKTLFISGASRGIGLAIAVRAARDGANVALIAKTAEPHPKLEGTIHTAAEGLQQAGGSGRT